MVGVLRAGDYNREDLLRVSDYAALRNRLLLLKIDGSLLRSTCYSPESVEAIARQGGTPLVVSLNEKVMGVIELQDIIKPGIRERFDRLRKMGLEIPIVVLSAREPEVIRDKAMRAGAAAFLQKPVDNETLFRALERAIKGQHADYIDPFGMREIEFAS